jgi:hypothetical protein
MVTPWSKKNPFMSMWLSGANRAAGAMRGRATAEAKRQAGIAGKTAAEQMVDFWADARARPVTTKRKKSA